MTLLTLLSVGWGLGLDRFYEGKTRDGFLSLVGWALILEVSCFFRLVMITTLLKVGAI